MEEPNTRKIIDMNHEELQKQLESLSFSRRTEFIESLARSKRAHFAGWTPQSAFENHLLPFSHLLIEDGQIVYEYPEDRAPHGDTFLTSVRRSKIQSAILDAAPNTEFILPAFLEVYQVSSYPEHDHGQHWHGEKIEVFTVLRGSWKIVIRDPRTNEVSEYSLKRGDGKTLLMLPGAWHQALPLEPESLLQVHSTSEYQDDAPDTYEEWPE